MKVPRSVNGWIASVEAHVLAPNQRDRLLLLKRHLKVKDHHSDLEKYF